MRRRCAATTRRWPRLLSEVTPAVIVDAVDEMLLIQRGKELGYAMGDEQFKSILENIRKENKIESEEQFQAALKQEGLSMLDLRRQLEKQMLVNRVQQTEVMGKISVTDDEVKAYYDANAASFAAPANVTLREILVAGREHGQGRERRRRRGGGAPRRPTPTGASAPASRSPSSPPTCPTRHRKPTAACSAKSPTPTWRRNCRRSSTRSQPGDVTAPRRTSRGYQILKLDARSGGGTPTMEEAHDRISERVFEQKRRGEFQKYLVRLRGQAIIEWKNDEVKKAYDSGLAAQTAAAAAGAAGALSRRRPPVTRSS